MGCGCNKRRKSLTASSTRYVLRMPDGTSTEHDTKLQAQAENARKGGGGRVTTKG